MVWGGGITGGRTDATIFFFNQVIVAKSLIRGVAPVLFSHFLVGVFSEGLGETVTNGFDHDGIVVVAIGFELIG